MLLERKICLYLYLVGILYFTCDVFTANKVKLSLFISVCLLEKFKSISRPIIGNLTHKKQTPYNNNLKDIVFSGTFMFINKYMKNNTKDGYPVYSRQRSFTLRAM